MLKFNWTKEQFDALQMGNIMNYGAGGTNYDDIVSVHGEPNNINTTTVNDHESRTVHILQQEQKSEALL